MGKQNRSHGPTPKDKKPAKPADAVSLLGRLGHLESNPVVSQADKHAHDNSHFQYRPQAISRKGSRSRGRG